MNPSHYPAWTVRRECIAALGLSIDAELSFVGDCILASPKNYQTWNHRLALLKAAASPNGPAELDFTAAVLAADAKNYHAWQHRLYCADNFFPMDEPPFPAELEFTDRLIRLDFRNNSAWSYRYHVIVQLAAAASADVEALRATEIDFVQSFIARAPSNECPWSYLGALVHRPVNAHVAALPAPASTEPLILAVAFAREQAIAPIIRAPAVAFWAGHTESADDRAACVAALKELCEQDPTRAPFWRAKAAWLEQQQ
jgi:protein farnesyltransferase/geranylgeranyltransferase type-1 subunit alpha